MVGRTPSGGPHAGNPAGFLEFTHLLTYTWEFSFFFFLFFFFSTITNNHGDKHIPSHEY
jgi:hypothetical protein